MLFKSVMRVQSGAMYQPHARRPIGSGTYQQDPMRISTLSNLLWVCLNPQYWNRYFIQLNDIDAINTRQWNNGMGWNNGRGFSPIGNDVNPFTGHYDGNGKKITNVYINRPNNDYQSIFGRTHGGSIKDLGVQNLDIVGKDYVGGLVGLAGINTVIKRCMSKNSIISGNNFTGGLLGYTDRNTNVSNCYSRNEVISSSTESVGGFVGRNNRSSIVSSYSTSTVINTSGDNISGKGFVGTVSDLSGYVMSRNVFDNDSTGQTSSTGASGRQSLLLSSYKVYTNWDFKYFINQGGTWNIGNDRNDSYAYLDWQYPDDPVVDTHQFIGQGNLPSPYQIWTPNDLFNVIVDTNRGVNTNAVFKLMDDIDASLIQGYQYTPKLLPICSTPYKFTGTFIGNDKTISHYDIDRPNLSNVGFIGHIQNGTVQNLKLQNCFIRGNTYTGGISGYITDGGKVINCQVNGQTEIYGNTYTGGIAGRMVNGGTSVLNCINNASITANGDYIGGISGTVQSGSIVTNCQNNGNITASGRSYIGGITGLTDGANSTVDDNRSLGTITANTRVGGIVGAVNGRFIHRNINMGIINAASLVGGVVGHIYNNGRIIQCGNDGYINGSSTDIGGVAGYVQNQCIVDMCYNKGNILGYTNVGGLIGRTLPDQSTRTADRDGLVRDCYSQGDVTRPGLCGASSAIGGLIGSMGGYRRFRRRSNPTSPLTTVFNNRRTKVHRCYSSGRVNANYSSDWGSATSHHKSIGAMVGNARMMDLTNVQTKHGVHDTSKMFNCFWDSSTVQLPANVTRSYNPPNGGGRRRSASQRWISDRGIWGHRVHTLWNTMNFINESNGTSLNALPRSTTQMMRQSTYTNWNFSSVWRIQQNQDYPQLRWQPAFRWVTGATVVQGDQKLFLSWNQVIPDAETNYIRYQIVNTGTNQVIAAIQDIQQTQYTIQNLQNGVEYAIIIRVVYQLGVSRPSSIVYGTPYNKLVVPVLQGQPLNSANYLQWTVRNHVESELQSIKVFNAQNDELIQEIIDEQ